MQINIMDEDKVHIQDIVLMRVDIEKDKQRY